MPIPSTLIELCNSACASYRRRIEEEKALDLLQKKIETELFAGLEAEKKVEKKRSQTSRPSWKRKMRY